MRERTEQEIFDLAFNGLRAQGFRKSKGEKGCLYRGPDGLKCAIGHCIADSDYRSRFEGGRDRAFRAAGVSGQLFVFAFHLQIAHDASTSPSNMEHRLRELANNYELTIPEGSVNA